MNAATRQFVLYRMDRALEAMCEAELLARGEQTESDVDFLVEYAPGARKSLLSHVRLINELEDALKADVDVVTEVALRPEIREEVLRERRAIM